MDLWAEFRLLDMGARLGRFISHYRLDYFQPDKRNGQVIFSYKPLPGAEQRIYDKISDITISMKSTDLLKMPELVSSEYTVRLSDEERQRYDELKQDLVLQLPEGDITAANAAALTGKLCQLANGAIYTDDADTFTVHDRKLDALEDIIEAAGGKPILVAYWFKHDLSRITERLQKLHVPFSKLDSADSIRKWNAGELPVALIHPASAGHGLNLQSGGSYIVWFGLTWSLELYQQTNARLWRQGQNSETVVVQHIVAKDTIDERILKVLSKKDSTQAALIDAVKADLQV
jgi:SNF2 family DNA or RNA helicase